MARSPSCPSSVAICRPVDIRTAVHGRVENTNVAFMELLTKSLKRPNKNSLRSHKLANQTILQYFQLLSSYQDALSLTYSWNWSHSILRLRGNKASMWRHWFVDDHLSLPSINLRVLHVSIFISPPNSCAITVSNSLISQSIPCYAESLGICPTGYARSHRTPPRYRSNPIDRHSYCVQYSGFSVGSIELCHTLEEQLDCCAYGR
jgi:hypothetical protein